MRRAMGVLFWVQGLARRSGAPSLSRIPVLNLPHHFFHLLTAQYSDERDLPFVMALVDAELSEPYSIFTYRYEKEDR